MLHDRDFLALTEQEKEEWNKLHSPHYLGENFHISTIKYQDTVSDAVKRYSSLFPNNILLARKSMDKNRMRAVLAKFDKLVQSGVNEQQILNFIRDERAYFIVGSLLKSFDFGHHEANLFREFQLPPDYQADFVLVGKASSGYQFIFVEFEGPEKSINGDGSFGKVLRKGLKQVEDWDAWIESHFSHLRRVFGKYCHPRASLPQEFIDYDSSRIHYAVVAGRRSDYNDVAYRKKRKMNAEGRVSIFHYDNLVENATSVIDSEEY